jgi:hypothetical protein
VVTAPAFDAVVFFGVAEGPRSRGVNFERHGGICWGLMR